MGTNLLVFHARDPDDVRAARVLTFAEIGRRPSAESELVRLCLELLVRIAEGGLGRGGLRN